MCKWKKEIIIYKGTNDRKGLKIKAIRCASRKRAEWFIDNRSRETVPIDLMVFEPGYEPCKSCSFKEL